MKVGSIVKQPSFGIHISTQKTSYGRRELGKYRDKYVNVHIDEQRDNKFYDIFDDKGNWLMSVLKYFQKGEKKVVKVENHKVD